MICDTKSKCYSDKLRIILHLFINYVGWTHMPGHTNVSQRIIIFEPVFSSTMYVLGNELRVLDMVARALTR